LIAVTGIVFGPALGFFYALVGETVSAIFIYYLGRKLGRATVRRVAGKRINELSGDREARLDRRSSWFACCRSRPLRSST